MDRNEREILEALDAAVRSAESAIGRIITAVERRLREQPDDVLAWEPIPIDRYPVQLPEAIRSSWVFVLRANVATGAERHPNSHQRMLSYRGRGDFQTRPGGEWCSHHLVSDPAAPLEERWISIPPAVWHQGVVGPDHWAVVSFHTVPERDLVEERPPTEPAGPPRRRTYSPGPESHR